MNTAKTIIESITLCCVVASCSSINDSRLQVFVDEANEIIESNDSADGFRQVKKLTYENKTLTYFVEEFYPQHVNEIRATGHLSAEILFLKLLNDNDQDVADIIVAAEASVREIHYCKESGDTATSDISPKAIKELASLSAEKRAARRLRDQTERLVMRERANIAPETNAFGFRLNDVQLEGKQMVFYASSDTSIVDFDAFCKTKDVFRINLLEAMRHPSPLGALTLSEYAELGLGLSYIYVDGSNSNNKVDITITPLDLSNALSGED